MNQFSRTELQIGQENLQKLHRARVAVFGVGGVGGHCAEALCRAGVGAIDLYDDDKVCLTNLNRQLVALHSTLGQYKVDALRARLLDINPAAQIATHRLFYGPDTAEEVDLKQFDCIVDAVDTVTAKLELACRAAALGVPLVSAMGAANKLDPTALRVGDINQTEGCPLARIMRKELRRRGVRKLRVVWSPELPTRADGVEPEPEEDTARRPRRQTPASNPFVPPAAGLIVASEVTRILLANREE